MRLSPNQRVTMETAKRRALVFLSNQPHRTFPLASGVGQAIWPDNNLRAQGLGFAASKVLRILKDEGLIQWRLEKLGKHDNHGYAITQAGRARIKDNK